MRHYREPNLNIFWDTCLWVALFELGADDKKTEDNRRKSELEAIMPNIEMGAAGVVFSPCVLADIPKNIVLDQLRTRLRPLEEYGYVTVLEETSDWDGIAVLRNRMRRDIETNPGAFRGLQPGKERANLGDVTIAYAAIKTGCHELWTYDDPLIAFSGRASVNGITICRPHTLGLQGLLDLGP